MRQTQSMTSIGDFWLRESRPVALLGVRSDWADAVEGDWLAVELFPAGRRVRRGESFGFITTDRATHDLRAPVDFEIVEVNARVVERPHLTRLAPQGEGWLLRVRTTDEP
jgi:glycine cleavage system H protein